MNFKLLFIFILFGVLFSNAQTTTTNKNSALDNDCPPPKESDYKALCAHIATRTQHSVKSKFFIEYVYEMKLLQLACVNLDLDDEITATKKLQLFWNKFKTNCKCDTLEFHVPNGNILKFSLSQNMPSFIETLAATYRLDINFIDPADGLNLLDYVNEEIVRLKRLQNSDASVKIYEEYKAAIIGLGGKSNKQ